MQLCMVFHKGQITSLVPGTQGYIHVYRARFYSGKFYECRTSIQKILYSHIPFISCTCRCMFMLFTCTFVIIITQLLSLKKYNFTRCIQCTCMCSHTGNVAGST